MTRRRRRSDEAQLDAWLAGRLLDEALSVFGTLGAAAHLDERHLDRELRQLLRTASLELLDDVAVLAPLVSAVPAQPWSSPWSPSESAGTPVEADEPVAVRAVEALARYAERLSAIAAVFAARQAPNTALFAWLATRAEARMELLAS